VARRRTSSHDDELVCSRSCRNTSRCCSHGFARVPQTDLSPESQRVSSSGWAWRSSAGTRPIGGRIERDADLPSPETTSRPTFPFVQPAGTGPGPLAGTCQLHAGRLRHRRGRHLPYPYSSTQHRPIARPALVLGPLKAVRYILRTGIPGPGSLVEQPRFRRLGRAASESPAPVGADSSIQQFRHVPDRSTGFRLRRHQQAWPEVVAELLSFYASACAGSVRLCVRRTLRLPRCLSQGCRRPTEPTIYLPETGRNFPRPWSIATSSLDFNWPIFIIRPRQALRVSIHPRAGTSRRQRPHAANPVSVRKKPLETRTHLTARHTPITFYASATKSARTF